MKKSLLLTLLFALFTTLGFSQTDKFWSGNNEIPSKIITDKAVARLSFPTEFKLFNLNIGALRQQLFSVAGSQASRRSTIISLPNADGGIEQFEVVEASNFEPALQAQFPEIRAFSGKGITDRYATLKLSISPQGIQTMVFRTGKGNEFIEPYSQDHTVYSVFRSQRSKGSLPWTCTTEDQKIYSDLSSQISNSNRPASSTGELKTIRLAQSCNAEYSNYFGATSAADVALVLAAFNGTLTRCNGCYEKDLALHLNLIANTTAVIYYNAATDPYTNMGAWNGQLQSTLNTVIGAANYDIGHMFGATGGGGNAGCIGCVCGTNKGSGITSPADGIPQGDNFDIDYVAHEVGHQLGGNHTFSHGLEGSGVNKEVGSGITIMGYAGITSYDVAPHSIDIFHEATIAQIQANLATKTCPITTNITADNATPVIAALTNYTIPISTPFALTGSATDANAGDALTYCWEQNDNATTSGANSVASPTKATGPNWLSFSPTASPTRTCPILPTILAGAFITNPLPGGDAAAKIEALSSVSRTLNFRLTVRDNVPYSSTAPIEVGQTSFADMAVTVTNTSGPFKVTQPNTNVSWAGGSTQTITWDVANTTGAPVSCANVKISISTDGGFTFPTVLIASTTNDGTENVTIPSTATTTARIKVESIGNIFFDIDDSNFTITAPATGFTFNNVAPTSIACGASSASATLVTASQGGFVTPINLSATGNPAGTSVTFSVNPVVPGNSSLVTLTNTNTLAPGTYDITVNGVAGAVNQSGIISFIVQPGTPPSITTQPAPVTVCAGGDALFSVTAPGAGLSYQWQVSTGGPFGNITGATSATYTATAVTGVDNNNQYQVIVSTLCGTTTSSASLLTVNTAPAISAQPVDAILCAGNDNTFTVTAIGAGLAYQWQVSTIGCGGGFVNMIGETTASLTLTNVNIAQNGFAYRCNITGTCAPTSITSTCVTLSVSSSVGIVNQPVDVTACSGTDAVFTVDASGTGVNYQWQVSTDGGVTFTNITGAIGATLTVPGVTAGLSGNQYQAVLTNATCTTPSFSTPATLTVNELPAITAQPSGTSICAGSDGIFTSTATGTNISYQWQVSTDGGSTFSDIPGAISASYTAAAATSGMNNNQYHVIVSGTCTPSDTSLTAILTVISPAGIATQPVNVSACDGSDATLTVTGTSGGAPAIVYQWQESTGGPFTNIAGGTNATLTLTGVTPAMNGYQYQVLVSNATCAAQATSTTVTLTVNSLPVVTAAADATSVCTGAAVTLTAGGAGSYTWNPGGLSGATVTINPAVDPANPGVPNVIDYTATGTDGNGCINTATVTVTANPLPAVTLTATPNATLLPGQSVLLTASVTPTGTYTYAWEKDGISINNTGNTLTVNAGEAGAYTVTADDGSGTCSGRSNTINLTDSTSAFFYIYPNPNNGVFNIDYPNPGGFPTKINVIVYDSHGKRVYIKAVTMTNEVEKISVDLRPASSGTYIIAIHDGSGNRLVTEKVVVQL